AWLPLAIGLASEVGQRRRVVYLALAVAMMALAGQPELLIFSIWWLPIWAAFGAASRGRSSVVLALIRVWLGVGLGIGLAAFQLLPVVMLLPGSNRQADLGWDFQTGASLPPWHLLGALQPLVFGDPRNTYWPGPGYEWHERLLFIGLVPLIAAARAKGRWRW